MSNKAAFIFLKLLFIRLAYGQAPINWCSSCDDPHITTFDSLDYEFHEFGQHYILYTDMEDIVVSVGFTRCAEDTTLSCNCAVYIRNRDTVLFMDICGISTADRELKFYYTIKDRRRAYKAPCDSKLVNPTDETNNRWWNNPGNAVIINSRLMCAKMRDTDTYVIRTNNLYMEENIFVRIIVHPLGISCVYVKPSPKSFGNTGGLCGLWNDNDADDGYILGKNNKKVYLDLPYDTDCTSKMGRFWRLTKFPPASQQFRKFDLSLYCPCDSPSIDTYEDDLPYWIQQEMGRFCYRLVSRCVTRTDSYIPQIKRTMRSVRAKKADENTARNICEKNIMKPDIKDARDFNMVDINPIMKMCISDFMETNDVYWSLTQWNLARNHAIRNIEQKRSKIKKTNHLRMGYFDRKFYEFVQNKTFMDSLKRPLSEAIDNFTEILHQNDI